MIFENSLKWRDFDVYKNFIFFLLTKVQYYFILCIFLLLDFFCLYILNPERAPHTRGPLQNLRL